MKDYKDKQTYVRLGLKKGKAAVRTGNSSNVKKKILVWFGLFLLVFVINYLFFIRFGPANIKGIIGPVLKNHQRPHTIAQWSDEGCKLYQEGNLIRASKAYTKAIALKPEDSKIYLNRGIVYVKMENYSKAINDLNRAISLNPDYIEAFIKRGLAYLKKANFDHAINDCNYALSLDPNMAEAYYTRGIAFRGKGLPDEAKSDFKKSCELGNNNGCQEYEEILYIENDGT